MRRGGIETKVVATQDIGLVVILGIQAEDQVCHEDQGEENTC